MRRRAAVLLSVALALGSAHAALASHDAPPTRTFTYEVQTRGDVQTDVEEFRGHAWRTLADVRGWSMGGSVGYHEVAPGESSHFTLWLADPASVAGFSPDCSAEWSCRVGRNVIINDLRWRTASPSWTLSLDEYQHYVVNHELGHWLGQGHLSCPGRGQPAPVMQQQSKGLQGCQANVWPLASEREQVADRLGVEIRPDVFSDIADSPHAGAVRELADAGIVTGFPDGTYRPHVAVERGQMAAYLARAWRLEPTGESDFTDIADSVHAEAIRAVADAGIALGDGTGRFLPRDVVTRGQMASFLARAAGIDSSDPSCAPPDSADSPHAGAICALLRSGIARGYDDGTYRPAEAVSRGAMAGFVGRAAGLEPVVMP